jgi:phosphate transport system protein
VTRNSFVNQIDELQATVLGLSDTVTSALAQSVEVLFSRDCGGSRLLVDADRRVDERRYAIEAEALTLIAMQAPIARDMRWLAATLFVVNELERIGDYAKGIARVNLRIGEVPRAELPADLSRMAGETVEMLEVAMAAYADRDDRLARTVIPQDDNVDRLYDDVYRQLMSQLIADPSRMRQANLLLMVAHNLERAADRATNICERVIYMATGELVDTGWEEDLQ